MEGSTILCLTKHPDRFRISQSPSNRSEHVQMLAGCRCRQKKQKHDIHGLPIDSLEINRLLKAREYTESALKTRNPRMGNGNSAAYAGRPKPFAL
jgi:hypothetical protein